MTCLESGTHQAYESPQMPSSILQFHSGSSMLLTKTRFRFGTEMRRKWPSGDHWMSQTASVKANCWTIVNPYVSRTWTSMARPTARRSPVWLYCTFDFPEKLIMSEKFIFKFTTLIIEIDMELNNGRIAVLGSANGDIFLQMDRLPLLGETLSASNQTRASGGKGAN